MKNILGLLLGSLFVLTSLPTYGQGLTAEDVFNLEYAADPRISPDASQVVYTRRSLDIMKDNTRSSLWIVDVEGNEHRPLAEAPASSARWSPDGKRLIYISRKGEGAHLFKVDGFWNYHLYQLCAK